jgi:unspecific monooxygenase
VKNDWSGQTLPHPAGRRRLVGDVVGVDRARPLQSTMARVQGLGPLVEMQVFGQKFTFVTGAALAAELCDESRFHKGLSPALEALRDFAGDGLFTAHDDEINWKLAHDLLLPAFTKEAMQRYHPTMLQTVRELFAMWDGQDGPVDVSAGMTKLTMETLSRAAFSHDFGSLTQREVHPFIPAMIAALSAGQRIGSLNAMPGASLFANRVRARNQHHQDYVDSMLDGIIAERRAGEVDDRDLLGIMLGSELDDLNIRYQILTFLVAGHETTSGALSFALYYLSRNPEVLARAQAETDAVLGPDVDAEPTYDQVAKLRYVRRVLDEALRLWPTAPAFTRSPRETTTLSTGHTMRPEDWAIVLLPMVHRDPEVWGDDADEFDPDRFSPERSRGRAPHAYKPFGTGMRSCIGRQFALHEAVLVLARLLHRYDVSGDPDYALRISERLTLMPEGFELMLRHRTSGGIPWPEDSSSGAPARS